MDDTLPDGYATHTINLLRVSAGMRQQAFDALIDLEGDLIGKITTASTPNNQARLNALLKQTQGSIAKTYETIAANQGQALRKIAKLEVHQTQKMINKALRVDIISVKTTERRLEKIADGKNIFGHSSGDWWAKQDVDLQRKFAGQMQMGMLSGEPIDGLIKRVRGSAANNFEDGIMGASRREAAALTRSSVISTANAARLQTYEDTPDVTKGVQWQATLDGKTTLICQSLSGLQWSLPDYEPIGHGKAWPGNSAHWNCVSEGQEADTHGQPILRGYSRDYVGTFVTIETARGHKLTVTPNHPILTAQGFVPAGDLREGGDVVSDFVPREKAIAGTGELDAKQRPALIEKITGSLQESWQFITVAVVVGGVDFHGDGMDGEVAIVSSHRDLLTEIQATGEEQAMEPGFLGADEIRPGSTRDSVIYAGDFGAFNPSGASIQPLGPSAFGSSLPSVTHGLAFPPDDMPRRPDPSVEAMGITAHASDNLQPTLASHIASHSSSPDIGRIAPPATGSHASGLDPLPDPVLSQAELAHQILEGSLGEIHFDQIISIRKWEGRRRVHNLETTRNFYSAQGIITGNCRSTTIPVLYSWEELAGKPLPSVGDEELEAATKKKLAAMGMDQAQIEKATVRSQASMDGQVSENLNFEKWLKGKDDAFIDRTLGPGRAKLWDRGRGQVSISDMTDQNARPITIKQLEANIRSATPLPETQGISIRDLDPASYRAGAATAEATARAAAQAAEQATRDAIREAAAEATAKAEATAAKAAKKAAKEAEKAAKKAAEELAAAQAKVRPPITKDFEPNLKVMNSFDFEALTDDLLPTARPGDLHRLTNAFPGELVVMAIDEKTHYVPSTGGNVTSSVISLKSITPAAKIDRYIYRNHAGETVIHNTLQVITNKGTGRGLNTFLDQANAAKALGISKLETEAAGSAGEFYNGYYTWPRFGYDAPLRASEIAAAKAATGIEGKTVLDLMTTQEGRDWWKKNGTGRSMEFDLSEGSRSWMMLNAYAKSKGRA